MDTTTLYIVSGIIGLFLALVFFWCYRIYGFVEAFLKSSRGVLAGEFLSKRRLPFFYQKQEIRGTYKGRDVVVGIVYGGLQGEFLPLPFIALRLRETLGYNLNRLPNYAGIEKNFLVYKGRTTVLWGVFDKNYPPVFSKNYLVIALERLLSTAEDVERGRTFRELFK